MNWKQRIEDELSKEYPDGNVSIVWHENDPEFIIRDTNINSIEEVCWFTKALWQAFGGELRIDPQDAYEVA